VADVRWVYRSLSTVRCSLTKPPPRLASHVGLGFHGVGHRAPRMGAGRLHPLPSVPQSGSRSAVIRAYEVDAGLFECVLNRFDGACFQDGPTSRTASPCVPTGWPRLRVFACSIQEPSGPSNIGPEEL
jgi:hypothetical protein